MHVVWTHKNGAELYMSGEKAGFDAYTYSVKLVALMAEWQPEKLPGNPKVIHAPLADAEDLSPEEIERTFEVAKDAAQQVGLSLLCGESALVSCASGLNRSGLVCGLVLVRYVRMTPDEAIEVIRKKRSPYALGNKVFRDLLHRQDFAS